MKPNFPPDHFGASKVLWDLAPIGYLIQPAWVPTELVHSPTITDDLRWDVAHGRHLIRAGRFVLRDFIFQDFFTKLGKHASFFPPLSPGSNNP